MSLEEGNKAITDLGFSLNFHNRSFLLNNSRGAGVNATTSNVDFALVTSQPLSELVWCPRKGICVKNTDCNRSLTEKEAASLWGLRPNYMSLSSSKSNSTKLNSLENIVDDKNDASSPCPTKFRVNEVDASERVSRSMLMDRLIPGQDEAIKTAGSSRSLGVANSGGGLSAIPGNACGAVIHSHEGPSRQGHASTIFVDQEGRSLLKIPEDKADNTKKFELSAENYTVAEATKDANREALQSRDSAENFRGNQSKLYLRKGKSKALSDGDVNDQISDDNMSHGSAGSCNSKVLVSSRNTKRSLDQQLMVTSKRLKQSTERDDDSFIRQNSSFMNWISKMVKGYPGCNQDEAPSSMLADVLTTHTEQQNHCQKPVDNDPRGVGFRNLFQSIWCSNNRVKGTKIYLDYRSSKASGYVKNSSSMVNVSAVPLVAYKISDVIPQDNDQSSKMCDQGIGTPSSSFSTKEIEILPATKNTISRNMANIMEVAKSSQSISSTDKGSARATEYCEEKEAKPFSPKRDYLGSLWITRFRPKISQPESNAITSDLNINRRVLPDSETISSSGPATSHVKGRNCFMKHEGLIDSEQVNAKDEQNLEVMASVFARRLDALKQVVPFDATCMPSSSMTSTCLFCGVRGHHIQACLEIAESELKELIHVIKFYDMFKDTTRLCVKCFQLSHWATECRQGSSRKSAPGSFVDCSDDVDLYSYRKDDEKKHLLEKNDHRMIKHPAPQGKSEENNKPDAVTDQLQNFYKLNQHVADASNPLGHVSCTQEVGEPSSRPQHKITTTMEGIFDAVRRLRLSRSNFIRLMDSQISPSDLKGLYLRVRLSNHKEDLCEKGYYVACIQNTATNQGARHQAGVKTSVGVTIGSFTCLIESRYISNQDFVEDELMTWWTETAKCGHGQNPSLDELEHKYKERQRLGF